MLSREERHRAAATGEPKEAQSHRWHCSAPLQSMPNRKPGRSPTNRPLSVARHPSSDQAPKENAAVENAVPSCRCAPQKGILGDDQSTPSPPWLTPRRLTWRSLVRREAPRKFRHLVARSRKSCPEYPVLAVSRAYHTQPCTLEGSWNLGILDALAAYLADHMSPALVTGSSETAFAKIA